MLKINIDKWMEKVQDQERIHICKLSGIGLMED